MTLSTHRSIIDGLGIVRAYELATGESASAPERGGQIRVRCPSRDHADEHPSCDLRPDRDAWVCRSCDASGGILDLAIAAGHARDRASAARWYEEHLGVAQPAQRSAPSRRPANPSDVRDALTTDAAAFRATHGIVGEFLTAELNAIRARVAKRLKVNLAPLMRPIHEGPYAGRERDPAWATVFTHALFCARAEILGTPALGDLQPPGTVLIRAEEIAAATMRQFERKARGSVARREVA